jgi:MinD-like ATPase involved in chromosome partitioning or flagellar assembly
VSPGVPVLLALQGLPAESTLLATFARVGSGVAVVRRCVDLADLLAAASAGTSRAAIVSADLRRLDHEAVDRLRDCGVAVIGVVADPGDDAEGRLRMLGVDRIVVVSPDDPAAAAREAADLTVDLGAIPAHRPRAGSDTPLEGPGRSGSLVAVWGPTGAPGRTTVATYLACETAALGTSTVLADADTYGASAAQLLGLLDESPGLAAATRAVNAGALDLETLAQSAVEVTHDLRVLTGVVRADRWPELRPTALAQVWACSRRLADLTVVDCGFGLEQDEELSYDTVAPRRNGATLATLAEADVLLAVGRADPIGLQRLIRTLPEARAAAPRARLRVLLTRVRKGPVGRRPDRQLHESLARHAGVDEAVLVPEDQDAYDRALAEGRSLREVAPRSAARLALASLARDLVPLPAEESA